MSSPTLQHVVAKFLPLRTSIFSPNEISLSNSERRGCCQWTLQAWKNRWPSTGMVSLQKKKKHYLVFYILVWLVDCKHLKVRAAAYLCIMYYVSTTLELICYSTKTLITLMKTMQILSLHFYTMIKNNSVTILYDYSSVTTCICIPERSFEST